MFLIILNLILSLSISTITLPIIRKLGIDFNFIDKPDNRKQHKKAIVRIGGVSIAIGFFCSIIITLILDSFTFNYLNKDTLILTILGSSFLYFLLGLWDDIRKLSPTFRLFSQFFVAIFLWIGGVQINTISLGFLNYESNSINLPNIISLLITIIWIVGITNAINWMDGLDGLATGICIISSFGFIVLSIQNNQYTSILTLSALIGSCSGFLRLNKHPAKILMGDGGSYLLGIVLASSSLLSISKTNQISDIHTALIIMFIPIIDMIYVILSRVSNNKSPFFPDRRHFHHRLLNIGLSHSNTVLVIYGLSLLFVILGISI
tara:strand:+ start:1501 stop:2460 length:960 start_codon:yes stop_codon:yes gene_type:complete